MEFLRCAQQEEVAPRRRAPKEDQDDHAAFDLPLARDVEHCWRRLAWRALLALSERRDRDEQSGWGA